MKIFTPAIRTKIRASVFLGICILILTACGNPKKPMPIAQEIVTMIIGELGQGDIIQIATHYRDKKSVNAFMQENQDRYTLTDTFTEKAEIVEDYIPSDTSSLAGVSIGYDSKTEQFKNLGVGIQARLAPIAETLVGKALHTSFQEKKEAVTLASKQSYYLGYMRLDEARRLDITLEQTTTKDKRNLYSFLYEVEAMLPEKNKARE